MRRGFLPLRVTCAPDADLTAQVLHLRWRYVLSADSGDCVRESRKGTQVSRKLCGPEMHQLSLEGVRVLRRLT